MDAARGIGRRQHEVSSNRHRQRLGAGTIAASAGRIARLGPDHIPGRMKRESTDLVIDHIAVVEIGRWEKLEVEPSLAGQRVRHRPGQFDGDQHPITLRHRSDNIAKVPIRIFERRFNRTRLRFDLTPYQPSDRVPLSRRCSKPHVPVGRDTPILLDNLHTADLRVGKQPVVPIAEDENIDGRSFQIARSGQPNRHVLRQTRHRQSRHEKYDKIS
ncbi:MAG TPA: hypothetical protein VFF84_08505 [Sphingobium sp.]|nr:hypothetical protein [Sphingobium sp.]